jgi:hypothetical protein
MKKLALTSLLAFAAVSSASAANFKIGNPMYRPDKGDFYNETTFAMDTEFDHYALGTEFGFGFYDWWTVTLATSGSYDSSDEPMFDTKWNWDYVNLGLNYRWFDYGNAWKGDIYGNVAQYYNARDDMKVATYGWTVGTRYGFVVDGFSLNAVAEAHNLSALGHHAWGLNAGLESQVWLGRHFNIVGGATYGVRLLHDEYIPGDLMELKYLHHKPIDVKLGINYNFCKNSYMGVYAEKNVAKGFNVAPMTFGAKFGIQF